MERIIISDKTLKQGGKEMSLSFREELELCRLIDRLNVDVIELPAIKKKKVDSLLIKSVASAVKHAALAVPVALNQESVDETWSALKEAASCRLQVAAPVSSVQMEFLYHMKPAAMVEKVKKTVSACAALTPEVEFIAEDASRGDPEFVDTMIRAAVDAGARHITFQENAGEVLPEEMEASLRDLISRLDLGERASFGIDCSDGLSLADACAVASIRAGIREIKAAAHRLDCVSLPHLIRILNLKGESFGVYSDVRKEEIRRVTGQIENLFRPSDGSSSPYDPPRLNESGVTLSVHDSRKSVMQAAEHLGYDLSPEDQNRVYEAFLSVAEKKEAVSLGEMEAIIAAEAMQVPPAVTDVSYVTSSGNAIGAMAHIKLNFYGKAMDGIAAGDGPVDAALRAAEQAIARHFELDNFTIQAITEGHESTGETIIRLRHKGKLYSGRGISTDIIGASIMAYINAANKIFYEEEEA